MDIFILSHIHLDHSADINTMVESAKVGTKESTKQLAIGAPEDAFYGTRRLYWILYSRKPINILSSKKMPAMSGKI
jgi:hypothetical protein